MKHSHGLSQTPFYRIWFNMLDRCNNPKNVRYNDYGKIGIKIEWVNFSAFAADMYDKYQAHCKMHGRKNTKLGRIDTMGNYNAQNCVFLTQALLTMSKKSTKWVSYRDKTMPMKNMAEKYNIPYQSFKRLTKKGWTTAKIVKWNNQRINYF